MFESVVSYILNKYLSRYIDNLDTDSLNISVWSGQVELTDLTLKSEALAGLELPVAVTRGSVGRISLAVPWTSLWSNPLVVTVSDVLVLAAPVASRPYDPELEQRLARAAKRSAVSRLERDDAIPASDDQAGFFERLVATILKNVQVFVTNIHVRYEDTISTPECPLAAGLCIQSISAETTNSKWKPATVGADASSVYKLVRLESLSVYWNPYCERGRLDSEEAEDSWRQLMADTLNTLAVSEERLDFLVKPLSAKLKVILNLSSERTVPHLLVDLVLQDTSVQLSRQQYLSLVRTADSFSRMQVNSQYRKYRPTEEPHGNAAKWWKYAYTCIVEKSIRPYSWERIKEHRRRYREYRSQYLTFLEDPGQKVELLDKLNGGWSGRHRHPPGQGGGQDRAGAASVDGRDAASGGDWQLVGLADGWRRRGSRGSRAGGRHAAGPPGLGPRLDRLEPADGRGEAAAVPEHRHDGQGGGGGRHRPAHKLHQAQAERDSVHVIGLAAGSQ